jgi:hypothetical protein
MLADFWIPNLRKKTMNQRKLLYYDARHHIYCYEPPITLEQAVAPVDDVAGIGIDTFVYQFGTGSTVFHLTDVGEIFGERNKSFVDIGEGHPSLCFWRAYENILSLKERGYDLLRLMVERAHLKGLEFFGSIRLNSAADLSNLDVAGISQFQIDHAEYRLHGDDDNPHHRNNLDWTRPEIRAERFALIEEAIGKYDLDGLELDWSFSPYYFEPGETEENRRLLTEFAKRVRKEGDNASRRRGRPFVIGARVLPTRSANIRSGLDVESWIEAGLIDYAAPLVYGYDQQMVGDAPLEWLVEKSAGTACDVYGVLQSRIFDGRLGDGSIEHYRAAAAACWKKGASAIYLTGIDWPFTDERRQVLYQTAAEICDVDVLANKSKQYTVASQNETADRYEWQAPLPLVLHEGVEPPGQTVRMYLADEPEDCRVALRLRLWGHTTHDELTISMNGTPLDDADCRRDAHSWRYSRLEYRLRRDSIRGGVNEIGFALRSRPDRLEGDVVVQSVELAVEHPAPQGGDD